VLDIPMITTSSADEGAHIRHPLAEYRVKECSGFSNTFMACPTLRRFSFTLPVSDERREYPCYTRGPDGKAQLEGFDLVGKDSWRDGV
jgi:hypothetical protein